MKGKMAEDLPQIHTAFDHAVDHPYRLLYQGSMRNALFKLLPKDFFFMEETGRSFTENFSRLLPIFKWSEWDSHLSIVLLSTHRANGAKFFYEMVSRWLMPGKRLNISSFFATDFQCDGSSQRFTLSEVVLTIDHPSELERIRFQLPVLESEIRLGLLSVYHANRILEIKGLSADEKTSLIQERIATLLEKWPKQFQHDIFSQMQHFLVMCGDEFKALREYTHMSRIIYVFYFFVRALRDEIEEDPLSRFVHVRLSRTYLHLPLGLKQVVGVFIAVNLLNESELFEERHFVRLLKTHFPGVSLVEDSCFSRLFKEERIQLLYLEVEKEGGAPFSSVELKQMREKLGEEIRDGIEKVSHSLFMPRNEEEVMRNIITLSNELRSSRDIPQVIITFDGQREAELSFTVIWLRVLKSSDASLQVLFEKENSFALDRVKRVGMLRNKYPKEASVFRLFLPADPFLRSDHSIDLFKGRQAVVEQLRQILGEFRDFNGGMIAKQHEQFLALKGLFTSLDLKEELLLENFFHSIFPIELRSLFNPLFLKKLFAMLLEGMGKKIPFEAKNEEHCSYILFCDPAEEVKEKVTELIVSLQIPTSQLLTSSLEASGSSYFGCIYLEREKERREKFIRALEDLVAAQCSNL